MSFPAAFSYAICLAVGTLGYFLSRLVCTSLAEGVALGLALAIIGASLAVVTREALQ